MIAVEHHAEVGNVFLQTKKWQGGVRCGEVNDSRHSPDLVQELTIELGAGAVVCDRFHSVVCATALRLALVLGGRSNP